MDVNGLGKRRSGRGMAARWKSAWFTSYSPTMRLDSRTPSNEPVATTCMFSQRACTAVEAAIFLHEPPPARHPSERLRVFRASV